MVEASAALMVHAVLLGERIDLRGLRPEGMVSQTPLAWRTEAGQLVALFRFGAIVFFDVDESAQTVLIDGIKDRIVDPFLVRETESAVIAAGVFTRDQTTSDLIGLVDLADERLLTVADVLAKSVALARDEKQVTTVFDRIEPFARDLSATGGSSIRFRKLASMMGDALGAQARIVGGVEVADKPDLLWERPDLQRLHTVLAEEYELHDRARVLSQKLKVVEECASALVGFADARRAYHLEWTIIILIAFEIALTLLEKAGVIS